MAGTQQRMRRMWQWGPTWYAEASITFACASGIAAVFFAVSWKRARARYRKTFNF